VEESIRSGSTDRDYREEGRVPRGEMMELDEGEVEVWKGMIYPRAIVPTEHKGQAMEKEWEKGVESQLNDGIGIGDKSGKGKVSKQPAKKARNSGGGKAKAKRGGSSELSDEGEPPEEGEEEMKETTPAKGPKEAAKNKGGVKATKGIAAGKRKRDSGSTAQLEESEGEKEKDPKSRRRRR